MDIKTISSVLNNGRLNESNNKVADKPSSASSNAGKLASTADKVTLSGLSKVRDLETKAAASNISNSEKIASLKAAISDGSYQVNAQNIAQKLIQTETLIAGA